MLNSLKIARIRLYSVPGLKNYDLERNRREGNEVIIRKKDSGYEVIIDEEGFGDRGSY